MYYFCDLSTAHDHITHTNNLCISNIHLNLLYNCNSAAHVGQQCVFHWTKIYGIQNRNILMVEHVDTNNEDVYITMNSTLKNSILRSYKITYFVIWMGSPRRSYFINTTCSSKHTYLHIYHSFILYIYKYHSFVLYIYIYKYHSLVLHI